VEGTDGLNGTVKACQATGTKMGVLESSTVIPLGTVWPCQNSAWAQLCVCQGNMFRIDLGVEFRMCLRLEAWPIDSPKL